MYIYIYICICISHILLHISHIMIMIVIGLGVPRPALVTLVAPATLVGAGVNTCNHIYIYIYIYTYYYMYNNYIYIYIHTTTHIVLQSGSRKMAISCDAWCDIWSPPYDRWCEVMNYDTWGHNITRYLDMICWGILSCDWIRDIAMDVLGAIAEWISGENRVDLSSPPFRVCVRLLVCPIIAHYEYMQHDICFAWSYVIIVWVMLKTVILCPAESADICWSHVKQYIHVCFRLYIRNSLY